MAVILTIQINLTLRVAGVTASLAESNGSLPPGLWLTSPTGWLPRTGISSGILRSVIEYGQPLVGAISNRIISDSTRKLTCTLFNIKLNTRDFYEIFLVCHILHSSDYPPGLFVSLMDLSQWTEQEAVLRRGTARRAVSRDVVNCCSPVGTSCTTNQP